MEELKCPHCKHYFDEFLKTPRLLYNCGHTLCEDCITNFIIENESYPFENFKNNSFKCPEDDEEYKGDLKVEMFPKNLMLIKLIKKKESNTTIIKEILEKENVNSKLINNSYNLIIPENNNINEEKIKSPVSKKDEININPIISNLRSSLRKGTNNLALNNQINNNTTLNLNLNFIHPTKSSTQICPIHPTRILELICIEDKIKICTNCGLFGEHKNHKLINEEDFLKEIEVKAEILIELFELIDNNINNYKNNNFEYSTTCENLLNQSQFRQSNIIQEIKKFSENFITKIKLIENEILNELNQKFEKINNKILAVKEIPDDLLIKSNNWKGSVQIKLDKLNEVTESNNLNEDFVKLIETNLTDQDLITHAEDIINEFEKIKNFKLDKIEKIIENNSIQINSEIIDRLDFMKIYKFNQDQNEEFEILNLDDDEIKRLDNFKINKNENINTRSSIFTTCFSNDVDLSQGIINHSNNFNNNLNNLNNIEINNSFLNLSEDSSLLKIRNSIMSEDKFNIKNFNSNNNKSNSNSKNVINSKFNYNTQTSPKNNKQKTLFNSNVNVIKLPINLHHNLNKEKSKSPLKKSNVLEKDKIVFIKSQFKNECANFTGYEIGEDGAKAISNILLNNNSTTLLLKLKEIKLTKTNLTDESAGVILKSLELNQHLQILNLSKNLLTDKSIENIVNFLNKNKSIKSINLSNNNFNTIGKDKIKSYGGGSKNIKIFI